MNEQRSCPQCRAPLSADAPLGLCPECLLKQGFESRTNTFGSNPDESPGGFTPPTPPTPEELAPYFPQLEIQTLLGHGGMGAVYRVRQKSLDRLAALKILPPKISGAAAFPERFHREARTLARLSHPNIVVIYESGQAQSYYYLLMEYIDGVNLRQAIQAQTLPPEKALGVVPQICDALQYAHEEGVVHRDIKPENILLDKRGRVKIADFGLAKLLGRSPVELTLTATHQIMGTLHYMAPEQFERPLAVDHRADIYSLGVVFYELLTGDLPLGRFKLPSESAKVDARLDDVVLKTLERKPEARYQHASEVKTDVESIAWDAPARGAPRRTPRPAEGGPLTPSQQRLHYASIAMLVVGGLHVLLPLMMHVLIVLAVLFDVINQYDADNLLWMFLSVPPGLLILAGGWSMYRRALYPLAIAGIVAAFFPSGPVWLAGIPVGILACLALRQPGIRESFTDRWNSLADYEPFKESVIAWITQDRVRMPGVSLIVLGAMNLLLPLAVFSNDDFAPLLVGIPAGAFMIAGGIAMLKMRWYGLAMTGAIAALIPCGPVWVLSLPAGIWALVVLRRDDVIEAFALFRTERPRPEPPPVNVAAIRRQTGAPGLALVAASCMGLAVVAAIGVVAAVLAPNGPMHRSESFLIFAGLPVALSLPFFGLMVLGGWKLRQLEVYGLSLAASVAAVLPLHPMVVLTFPIGIWSLALLARRDVRAAFARAAAGAEDEETTAAPQKYVRPDDEARRRLTLPSYGLLLAGIVDGLVALVLAGAAGLDVRVALPDEIKVTLLVSSLAGAAIFVIAGMRMLQFRSYPLAIAAALLAMTPTSPAWPISLIAGMNALVRLASRDIRREFEVEKRQTAERVLA